MTNILISGSLPSFFFFLSFHKKQMGCFTNLQGQEGGYSSVDGVFVWIQEQWTPSPAPHKPTVMVRA